MIGAITNRERYRTVDRGLILIISRHPCLIDRQSARVTKPDLHDRRSVERGRFPDEWARRLSGKKLNLGLIAVQLMSTRGLSGAETTSDMHECATRCTAYFVLALMPSVSKWPGSLVFRTMKFDPSNDKICVFNFHYFRYNYIWR